MRAQFLIEFLRAFLGEKDSGPLEFDAASRAGNVLGQPVGPFHIEIHIIRSPNDQCRSFQRFQPSFDGERVFVVKGCEEPFEVSCSLFAPDQRTQIFFDTVVTQLLRVVLSTANDLVETSKCCESCRSVPTPRVLSPVRVRETVGIRAPV